MEHFHFLVFVDGVEVGREVRTDRILRGPFGRERLITSHSFTRMKMGSAYFDKKIVHAQRTEEVSGRLLRASFVSMDHVDSRVFLAAFNGNSFERLVETKSNVSDPPLSSPSDLDLSGKEVIGFRINDLLRQIVSGNSSSFSRTILYYEPLLDSPLKISISDPLPSSLEINNQEITGHWIEAKIADSDRVVIRSFFDRTGVLWKEEYPEIHQVLLRNPGPLNFSLNTSELIVGLFSDAYISNPNNATKAVFHLSTSPDRIDSLSSLDTPLNQELKRVSSTTTRLIVWAGAPDGDDLPSKADLGSTRFIQPKSRDIINSLRYLRTGGKRGSLSKERKYNTTSVIARSSLIQNPKSFWKDPDEVARLIMLYVSALLPDKRHTFSMSDAVTTLKRGAGDCTEHAVLFASLMRAANIPTRLVTGMYLTNGGLWVYHMWNSYWNGTTWRSIDPGTLSYRPGALHVALGRGASRFEDVRDLLADFMWKTFSGVSFNLVEASNNGEILLLAKPRKRGGPSPETSLLNAIVLSERGDHKGALHIIDENFPSVIRPFSVRLMRIELLVLDDQCGSALKEIPAIRHETSSFDNLLLLDRFELTCLLETRNSEQARSVFERMDKSFTEKNRPDLRLLLKSQYLFGLGREKEAILLLSDAISANPHQSTLLKKYAQYVASSSDPRSFGDSFLNRAFSSARHAAMDTHYSDLEVLRIWARLLIATRRYDEAYRVLDHALILAPDDKSTRSLRDSIPPNPCSSESATKKSQVSLLSR